MNPLPFKSVAVADRDAYREAGIELLPAAEALLTRNATQLTLLPESRGLARMINLLAWDVHTHHEYLDGSHLLGDQVIHLALHQAIAERPHMDSAEGMLIGEVIASCVDLYLVGRFIQAGQEPDFLHDSLESYGFYYDAYAREPSQFESFLSQLQMEPYQVMMAAATYLYDLGCQLLAPRHAPVQLTTMETHLFYPLAHHFNVTNWLLALRGQTIGHASARTAALRLLNDLTQGHDRLLALLDEAEGRSAQPVH